MIKRYAACLAAVAVMALSGCGQDEPSDKMNAGVTKPAQTEESSIEETDPAETTSETASVTETETAVVTTETETETVTETVQTETTSTSADSERNIISGVELRDIKEDVLARFGANYTTYENSLKRSTTYYYNVDGADAFDVDMKGRMFFEFTDKDDQLICYGYSLGEIADEDQKPSYPYSRDELKSAYDKITAKLIEWYGGEVGDDDLEGIDARYFQQLEDTSEIWAVYGVDMWSENSGINEIIFSRAISSDEMMTL